MRNGDYVPTRADAQYDAAAMICGVKVDQNPESTVGLLAAGGKGCVAARAGRWRAGGGGCL
jgi:26S proteasome regulatory subunit N10